MVVVVQRVVEARGHAVVLHLRVAAEGDELRAAALAERHRPVEAVLRVAVAAEDVEARREAPVDAGVELVRVELLGALRDVVVPGPVVRPGRVRQGKQVQEVLGLGRQAVGGDDVARELLALAGIAGERVVDVDAIGRQVAGAGRGRGHVRSCDPPTVLREPW